MSFFNPLNWLLLIRAFRQHLAFHLKYRYFQDLNIEVPVGENLIAILPYLDSSDSFSEIFLRHEYREFLQEIELPHKWIDIGCHMGYFSLYLENWRRLSGVSEQSSAILIDADSRTKTAITRLIERNKLSNRWTYQYAAIGRPTDLATFYEDDYMASTSLEGAAGKPVKVDVCKAQDIEEKLPGYYDLVKVDIEGSEWDFLNHYEEILQKTRYLLLEWHSWHGGGGGFAQLKAKIFKLGFLILSESKPQSLESKERQVGLILAEKKC